jgi:hypothetical protein
VGLVRRGSRTALNQGEASGAPTRRLAPEIILRQVPRFYFGRIPRLAGHLYITAFPRENRFLQLNLVRLLEGWVPLTWAPGQRWFRYQLASTVSSAPSFLPQIRSQFARSSGQSQFLANI